MTKNEKNDIFYIYYVILQYYKMINPSGDFCPILSRSQNIVRLSIGLSGFSIGPSIGLLPKHNAFFRYSAPAHPSVTLKA